MTSLRDKKIKPSMGTIVADLGFVLRLAKGKGQIVTLDLAAFLDTLYRDRLASRRGSTTLCPRMAREH